MTIEKCVIIFLKTIKDVVFDINLMFSIYFVKSYGSMMIFILVYMPNLLKVSECKHTNFCYAVDLKFVQTLS